MKYQASIIHHHHHVAPHDVFLLHVGSVVLFLAMKMSCLSFVVHLLLVMAVCGLFDCATFIEVGARVIGASEGIIGFFMRCTFLDSS